MLLTREGFRDLVDHWSVGRWFERLASWLIKRGKYRLYFDNSNDGGIYLVRMYILGNADTRLALWLHFFPRGDNDRALHSHPFPYLSWVVDGSYWEEMLRGWVHRRKNSIVFRTSKSLHRVHTDYAWTIVLRGPKMHTWGFLVNGKMVPWWKFLGLPKTED